MESRGSILRISYTKTKQLIELYEQEPCLWNTTLPNYKNRAPRFAAAKRIAGKLGVDNFTAKHVLVKFKNLRNSYCQELKKIATSKALGVEPPYKPSVFWFAKMDSYLRPHLHQLHPLDHDIQQMEVKDDTYQAGPNTEFVELSNFDNKVTVKTELLDLEETTVAKMPPKPKYCPDDSDNSSGYANSHETKLRPVEPLGDCFDMFGKYVTSLLRTMPKQKAMELQPKIVTLLTSVDFDSIEAQKT